LRDGLKLEKRNSSTEDKEDALKQEEESASII